MRMRRREDDNIYPLRGWKALLHKTIMLLLFPLRKPLIFFPVLFILFMAPTFRGVKPAEVHLWYWSKIKQYTSVVTGFVSEKTKDVLPKDFKITMPSLTEKKVRPKRGLISWSIFRALTLMPTAGLFSSGPAVHRDR